MGHVRAMCFKYEDYIMSMAVNADAAALSVDRFGYMEKRHEPSRTVYYFTLAVLVMGFVLVMGGVCQAADLLSSGNAAVNDTVGQKSSVMRWLMMLEVLSAIFAFIITRNMKVLGGIVAIAIFINVCYAIIK